ncbi:MAG: flippase-like domain-containing protein [Deltaproteobacteria bacterium]|nr:flippase-like domain-containing protein [Deltaproteobacteria bacterium]
MTVSPRLKIIGEDILVYGIALAIIWYESRGLSYQKELHDLADANLWWFVPATAVSFLIWFLGENLLFARLFTFFHQRTGYVEMLPGTAAFYFLQAANVLLADGALMVFLHHRKGVPWIASGFTLAYFGFIDGLVFSFTITAAGILVPNSPVHAYIPYSVAALTFFLVIAAWWLWRTPRYSVEKWLYKQPSLHAFREATPAIYGELLLIRFLIVVPQGLLLWICLASFHLKIPLIQVWAESPLMLAAAATPITPAGLGPLQAVAVHFFGQYAPEAKVMAAMLAFSVLQLIYRLPLGLGSAGAFVHAVLEAAGVPETESTEAEAVSAQEQAPGGSKSY